MSVVLTNVVAEELVEEVVVGVTETEAGEAGVVGQPETKVEFRVGGSIPAAVSEALSV